MHCISRLFVVFCFRVIVYFRVSLSHRSKSEALQTCIRLVGEEMEGVSSFLGMMVLTSQNYTNWTIKMEHLLIVKDLCEPINRAKIPTGV